MTRKQMIRRLVAAQCADKPESLRNMGTVELEAFYEATAPIRKQHSESIQRVIRRVKREDRQREQIQHLWEWSCSWIKRTRHPRDQYPFPSKAVAAWLIQIKEKSQHAHLP